MEKTSKKSSPRLQLTISIMITAALFLAELYVMINESANIVLLVGIGVLILIALYFVIDAVLDCANEKDIANREQYDNIYRSEKASYMLMKKHLEEMAKQIRSINQDGGKVEDHSVEVIKAQKAIAKITMSKNKESQDRLFIELNNLEASLKDSIFGLSMKLSGFQEEIERLADHIATINAAAIQEAANTTQIVEKPVSLEESAVEEVSLDMIEDSFVTEEDIFTDDLTIEESITEELEMEEPMMEETVIEESSIEDLFAEEPEIGVEDELDVLGSLADVTEDTSELDFESMDLGTPSEEDVLVESEEDILSQLLAAEEASESTEEVDALAELAKAVDAPAVEETPVSAPVTAPPDNGGKMGQDDIAALIASMTGGDAAPTVEAKPEPAPAPVADNPNKMMTPEEIAALIAGTNS